MFYVRFLFAKLYDTIILLSVFFAFTAVCLLIRRGQVIPPSTLWYQLSLLVIVYFYHALSYQYGGQTIGMRAWRFRLVSFNEKLSQKQIGLRFLLMVPAVICSVLFIKHPRFFLEQWTGTKMTSTSSL